MDTTNNTQFYVALLGNAVGDPASKRYLDAFTWEERHEGYLQLYDEGLIQATVIRDEYRRPYRIAPAGHTPEGARLWAMFGGKFELA